MGKSGANVFGTNKEKAPRAHVETLVFTFGARPGKELPFVMGVMADLSGKPKNPLPAVNERKFLEIDSGNFDARLKAMKPRVAFQIPSQVPGATGDLPVELEFESMDDFLPAAVARKVPALARLLAKRDALTKLQTKLDGNPDGINAVDEILSKIESQ